MHVSNRDITRLNVNEWRSNKDLVLSAAQTLADPRVRRMLDCLRNTNPSHYIIMQPIGHEALAQHVGRCNGYTMALNDLELLAKFEEPKEELFATFEPSEFEIAPLKPETK